MQPASSNVLPPGGSANQLIRVAGADGVRRRALARARRVLQRGAEGSRSRHTGTARSPCVTVAWCVQTAVRLRIKVAFLVNGQPFEDTGDVSNIPVV